MFTKTPESHPNWTADSTIHPTKLGELNCMQCHGSGLQGVGIAPSCYGCHDPSGLGGPIAPAEPALATKEQCTTCHPQNIGTADHQAVYNKFLDGSANGGTVLAGAIGTVTATPNVTDVDGDGQVDTGTYKVVVNFTLNKGGTGLNAAAYTALGQKRLSWTKYENGGFYAIMNPPNAAGKQVAVSFGAAVAGSTAGNFTTTCAKAPFDPTTSSTVSFLYFYFADTAVVAPEGHYFLPDNTISMSKVWGTIGYATTANYKSCENCHGAPYSKHGYRQAVVAGLPPMVACKACHYNDRVGTDFDWQVLRNEPETLAALTDNGLASANWTVEPGLSVANRYPYVASVMNDTHMSHGMEFPYPQSMANCSTCHANDAGVLADVNKDANFNGLVCKSCHATVAGAPDESKRAPLLAPGYHTIDWTKGVLLEGEAPTQTELACSFCHADNVDLVAVQAIDPTATNTDNDGKGPVMFASVYNPAGTQVPLFKDLHDGYNKVIYSNTSGARYATAITTSIDSASVATNKITFTFSVAGANPGAIVKPTVVVSLYGYDTKDFIVGGHGSAADGKRNLEWAEGASGNSSRLVVTKGAGQTWTAVADLSSFITKYGTAAIKRAELGVLPALGIDQSKSPDNAKTVTVSGVVGPNPNYNAYLAISGITKTFDIAGNAILADASAYGRDIVDPAKCNKCHDALAVEFHSPNYGGAGVVACRLCHIVGSGGSHLEMQSRSIDSYIHAIHSFQAMDVGGINFADPVQDMEYNHHTGFTYPRFTTLSCESCHNAGKYDMPDATRSLPGILSGSSTVNKARNIGGISTVVVGPAGRACGGCHRAQAIKTDDAARLAQYDQHTGTFGIRQGTDAATPKIADVLDAVIWRIFGAPTP
jgi:OmcA/MtrC family decaheme c-type cytochrome